MITAKPQVQKLESEINLTRTKKRDLSSKIPKLKENSITATSGPNQCPTQDGDIIFAIDIQTV